MKLYYCVLRPPTENETNKKSFIVVPCPILEWTQIFPFLVCTYALFFSVLYHHPCFHLWSLVQILFSCPVWSQLVSHLPKIAKAKKSGRPPQCKIQLISPTSSPYSPLLSPSLSTLTQPLSCHATASSYEPQPCRKWNAQYTQVFGLLQPLSGEFLSNDVTSGSLPVTWGHVMSFPVTWLPPPASHSLVGRETHSIREFSAFYSYFQVTSGQMTSLPGHFRSPQVTWCHLAYTSFRPSTATSGHIRSNDVTSGWLPVTWGNVTSFPVTWRPPLTSHSLVGSETHSIRDFSAFYSHFQVASSQMTSLPGHFRSPEVTVMSRNRHLF